MEETRVFDLHRIFIGDLPWTFTFEIAFRTAILYLFALFLLRFVIGPRGIGQLSPFEYVIIIALGSAVGDPMFYPDVPLIHGMVVISVVVGLHRAIVAISNRSDKIEAVIEGTTHRLVKEGRLDLRGMAEANMSREEVFMELRHEGVKQLGEVERAYIELDGRVSTFLFELEETRPGLPLVPPWNLSQGQPTTWAAGDSVPEAGDYACRTCGDVKQFESGEKFPACQSCQGNEWMQAVCEPLKEMETLTVQVSDTR